MAIKDIIVDALGAYLSQTIINSSLPMLSGTEEGRFPKWILPVIVPRGATLPEEADREVLFDPPFRLTTLGFGLGFAGFLWYASREMDRAALSGMGADQMEFDLSKSDKPRIEISYIGKGEGDQKWSIDLVNADERIHDEADTGVWAHQKAEIMATRAWDKGGYWPQVVWMHHFDDSGHIVDNEGNILELDTLPSGKESHKKSKDPRVEILYIGATRYGEKWGIKAVNAEQDYYIEANTPEAAWKKAQVILSRIWHRRSKKPEIIYLPNYKAAGTIVNSAREMLDLGKEMSEFWEPEQPELFKAKRELTLEMEDISKSDDPIFACMERIGYKQKQMDKFSESIAKKATVDMFDKEPEDLTSSEAKFQDDIQSCIETVTKVFGSMEAAGYEDCDCGN